MWSLPMATNGNWVFYQNILFLLYSGRTGWKTNIFWELSGWEFSYGRTPYMSYNIKISSINWPFYGSAPWNNVGGRRCSDNFEATKCAHSWSFLPILFREHIEMETRLRKHLKHLPQSVRWKVVLLDFYSVSVSEPSQSVETTLWWLT